MDTPPTLKELVGKSPFGLYCLVCVVPFDGRKPPKDLRDHIKKKHPGALENALGRNAFKQAIVEACDADGQTYLADVLVGQDKKGMECSACTFIFGNRRKDNFNVHISRSAPCRTSNATAIHVLYRETICNRKHVVDRINSAILEEDITEDEPRTPPAATTANKSNLSTVDDFRRILGDNEYIIP